MVFFEPVDSYQWLIKQGYPNTLEESLCLNDHLMHMTVMTLLGDKYFGSGDIKNKKIMVAGEEIVDLGVAGKKPYPVYQIEIDEVEVLIFINDEEEISISVKSKKPLIICSNGLFDRTDRSHIVNERFADKSYAESQRFFSLKLVSLIQVYAFLLILKNAI